MSLKGYKDRVLPLKNKLYRFALSIVKDQAEAADVTQEVCIKVWRQWKEVAKVDNLEAWCMRLTRNQAIDALRSKHRRTGSLDQARFEEGDFPTPYELAASNDGMGHIRRYMERLPEKQRLVMQLRDIEELSYQEISEALEMPLNQVKINLYRARQQMRTYLVKPKSYGS